MTITLAFVTTNPHKVRETQQCLSDLAPEIQVVPLKPAEDVEEDAWTFPENALIKVKAAVGHSGQLLPEEVTHVMAEDAGLIVDALDGRYGISPFPGVRSNRWFSKEVQTELFGHPFENHAYAEINRGLLKLMEGEENRNARYESALACWNRKTDEFFTVAGSVPLSVAHKAQGGNGFGYDPIMIPREYDPNRVMAELSAEEKNRISHRFYALSALVQQLKSQTASSAH